MYILASHDIALAYALLSSDGDWSGNGSRIRRVSRRQRSISVWALGEALAWVVTLAYCLAALRLG